MTVLEFKSETRSDEFAVTTIDFSAIELIESKLCNCTHDVEE